MDKPGATLQASTIPPQIRRIIDFSAQPIRNVVKSKVIRYLLDNTTAPLSRQYLKDGYADRFSQWDFHGQRLAEIVAKTIIDDVFREIDKSRIYGSRSLDLSCIDQNMASDIGEQLGIKTSSKTVGTLRKDIRAKLLDEAALTDEITATLEIDDPPLRFLSTKGSTAQDITLPIDVKEYMGHACKINALIKIMIDGKLYSAKQLVKQGKRKGTDSDSDSVFSLRGCLNSHYGECGILIPLEEWKKSISYPDRFPYDSSWGESAEIEKELILSEQTLFLCPDTLREKLIKHKIEGSITQYERKLTRTLFYNKTLFYNIEPPDDLKKIVPDLNENDPEDDLILLNVLYYYFFTNSGKNEMAKFLADIRYLARA